MPACFTVKSQFMPDRILKPNLKYLYQYHPTYIRVRKFLFPFI